MRTVVKRINDTFHRNIDIVSFIFSAIFSIIFVLGHFLYAHESFDVTKYTPSELFVYFSYFIILWGIFLILFVWFKQEVLDKISIQRKVFLNNISDKKFFLLTSVAIFICYIPIIVLSTSTLSFDSWTDINQIMSGNQLNDERSIIFIGFITIFLKAGSLLGDMWLGITLFSIIQSMILATIFGFVITWMRKEKVSKFTIGAAFIFYAILPINSLAGIILWRDILFSGFGLLLLILLRKLWLEKNAFFTIKNITAFILLSFLFCTWRSNGFYAYIFFLFIFACILLFKHRAWHVNVKSLYATLLAPLVLFGIYSMIVTSMTLSSENNSKFMYGIPVQQIARTIKYHSGTISQTDKDAINKLFNRDLSVIYNPNLSDPVRDSMDYSEFSANKEEYIKLWLRLGASHKKTYLAAFLYNSYGYIYPYYQSATTTNLTLNNASQNNAANTYTDESYNRGGKIMVITYNNIYTDTLPAIDNIGFYVCIIIIILYIAIVRRLYELTFVFSILLGLFITVVLGPVNSEFRYLYLFVIATPFLLVATTRYKPKQIK